MEKLKNGGGLDMGRRFLFFTLMGRYQMKSVSFIVKRWEGQVRNASFSSNTLVRRYPPMPSR